MTNDRVITEIKLSEQIEKIKQNAKKPIKFFDFQDHSLKITSDCLKRISEFQSANPEKLIRIVIEGGGCQGFQYKFQEDFISEIGQKGSRDIVLCKINNDCLIFPILVFDLFSEFYIKDSTLDYENTLLFKGFSIKNNPKVKASCGCKKSFSSDEFFEGEI